MMQGSEYTFLFLFMCAAIAIMHGRVWRWVLVCCVNGVCSWRHKRVLGGVNSCGMVPTVKMHAVLWWDQTVDCVLWMAWGR